MSITPAQVVHKSPDEVMPGDIVIPKRGRYQDIQCEVKDVLRGRYSTYTILVVPVIPVADRWGVDYTERVRTLVKPRDNELDERN
jgi:hypothetical protein